MAVERTTKGVLIFFAMALCQAVAAQWPAVEVFSLDDGLPSQEILEIFQHPDGGLWIGTRSGLTVYDGRLFHPPPGEGLPEAPCGPLRIDERGRVWLLQPWSHPALYRLEGSRWVAVPEPSAWEGKTFKAAVTSLAVVAGGEAPRVAVGTEGRGLWLWDGTAWTHFESPGDLIFDLTTVGNTVAVAAAKGLFRLTPDGLDDSLRRSDARLREAILALHPASDASRLWILTSGWLGYLDGDRLTVVADPLNLPRRPGVLLRDRDGGLYFGTARGLRYRASDGRITTLGRREGLASDGALALSLDREANVWIGGAEGLSKIESRRFLSLRQDLGLLEDEVSAALETDPGRLVLGHNDGLSFVEGDDVRTLSFGSEDRSSSNRVLDLALDQDGNVWIAANQKGLLRLDPESRLRAMGLPIASSIEIDAHGNLWVTDLHTLFRYESGTFVRVDQWEDLFLRWINLAPDGRLFLSSPRALIVLEGDRREMIQGPTDASSNVYGVLAESSGVVWVGTAGGLYQVRDRRLVAARLGGRPFERPIYFLLRDPEGRLWLGTDDGVVVWDGKEERHLGVRHGLAGRETNRGAALVDSRGRVWIGTDRGISVYQEADDREPAAVPLATLAAIEVNGASRQLSEGELKLRPDENNITWHLQTLAFSRVHDVVVRYRLDGFDSAWQGPTPPTRELRYTNVPPGRYVFRVAAGWKGGAWGEEVSSVVSVARPLWREPWFLGLAGVLLAAGLAGVGWVRSLGVKRRLRELKQPSDTPRVPCEWELAASAGDTTTESAPQGIEDGQGAGVLYPPGSRLGPYEILREIGRGGMGAVFLARRADGEYHRQVAIKVMRPCLSSEGLRRFRNERQILASLDHPNIARMLDANTTHEGHPYIVMELVQGSAIHTHCDRRRLPVRERLALFLDVCSAVHYAHLHQIVHRDLKPSNIQVADVGEDASGRVKLLDFGIAKLLDAEAFPFTVDVTVTGMMPAMTPLYASPEHLSGRKVTAVSDVYSLGVVLYELLTRRLPFRPTGPLPQQAVQILLAGKPERPSLALSDREDVEMFFDTPRRTLRRQIAGDLDSIVLMALEKNPSRRYGSVEAFAEDIRCHLAGRPVAARRSQLGRRISRALAGWSRRLREPGGGTRP